MTATPLLTRIVERRNRRIGPVSPVAIHDHRSPFAKKLAERALAVRDFTWYNGALTPTDDGGAA